ncbi:hypothetical protein M422DRAFT_250591 [Sphaerobolus stellatus SS14]|uniref:Uncharacterized protein n=1 Tax=Sphaerobolus stellatus (strain SS14) TaxID=990650 RepID=A0A0C9W3L3_SPHS4|nr:hypothetical protein M422DRAFT_250591 [Sphaerobolus stellatus SS14]
MAHTNTILDITPLASSLKDFGGPNINLGIFEIREVMLGKIHNFAELVHRKLLCRMRF